MKLHGPRVVADRYVEVTYHQFHASALFTAVQRVLAILVWPFVLPLAVLARTSDFVFRALSEALSLVPFIPGVIVRAVFYRWTLSRCGTNVVIGFGSVFLYRDVALGDHVSIGMYNTVHYADIGSYVVIADGCRLLSGARYHSLEAVDVPMAMQGGSLRRITIADDCWIGANVVLMQSVGTGSVVGAGAVVTAPVEPYTIVAGNPARVIRRRMRPDQLVEAAGAAGAAGDGLPRAESASTIRRA